MIYYKQLPLGLITIALIINSMIQKHQMYFTVSYCLISETIEVLSHPTKLGHLDIKREQRKITALYYCDNSKCNNKTSENRNEKIFIEQNTICAVLLQRV